MQQIVLRRGAKTRTVYAPSRGERRQLRELLPVVAAAERAAATAAGVAEVAHGFVAARSPVTAAVRHVGYAVTVSCDLSGWFDSVRADQLSGLPPDALAQVLVDGAPRQGLPTSPACANLAAVPMDAEIVAALRLLPCRAVYTRYADDLVVSLSDTAEVGAVLRILADAASAQGWVIHPGKTKVQHASAGRRIVLGLAVDDRHVRATRETRRRLRASRHQNNQREAAGLAEWAACRLPKAARSGRQMPGVIGGASAKVVAARQPITVTETQTCRATYPSRAAGRIARERLDAASNG